MRTLFVCQESDKGGLELFKDLEDSPKASVVYIGLKHSICRWVLKGIFTIQRLSGLVISAPSCIYNWKKRLRPAGTDGTERIVVKSNLSEIIPMRYIQKLRRKGIRCEMFLIDSIDAGSYTIKKTRKYIDFKYWDDILTFDQEDADKYSFTFSGFHYYSKHDITLPSHIGTEIYFIGSIKGGREHMICDTARYLKANDVSFRFDVQYFDNSFSMPCKDLINYIRQGIPYREVLERTVGGSCILEIVQNGQSGPSLRYFEAVIYNKKLLTNNPFIVRFPYYNPEYMKVFKSMEDIDIEWIKSEIHVDYDYRGDFSPLFFPGLDQEVF